MKFDFYFRLIAQVLKIGTSWHFLLFRQAQRYPTPLMEYISIQFEINSDSYHLFGKRTANWCRKYFNENFVVVLNTCCCFTALTQILRMDFYTYFKYFLKSQIDQSLHWCTFSIFLATYIILSFVANILITKNKQIIYGTLTIKKLTVDAYFQNTIIYNVFTIIQMLRFFDWKRWIFSPKRLIFVS